mgnify:FL=1
MMKPGTRIRTSSRLIKAKIRSTAGSSFKMPIKTEPLKLVSSNGKSSIKKNRLKNIPKIGPSTMQNVLMKKGKNSFKGLKKSKPVNPARAINRGPKKR